jgi:60 kDa SS-A/Ro ribonucleoprotein
MFMSLGQIPRGEKKMAYQNHVNARVRRGAVSNTPQSLPIPARATEMVQNRAGGFVFEVSLMDRVRRFLILGSDSATYYAGEREMTLANVEGILLALERHGVEVVDEIVKVSQENLAPRNQPALYALALAGSFGVRPAVVGKSVNSVGERLLTSTSVLATDVRRAAFNAVPLVARTGTHVMILAEYLKSLRGWGRGPRNAIQAWFESMSVERLALQAVKYRQREGWTLRDILRLGHPVIKDEKRKLVIDWITHRDLTHEDLVKHEERVAEVRLKGPQAFVKATPRLHTRNDGASVIAQASAEFTLIDGYHRIQHVDTAKEAAKIIRDYGVPFECVPTQFLSDVKVWDALLVDMPMTNMIRNLGKMTSVGLLTNGSEASRHVAQVLSDETALHKAKVHPFSLLLALKVYGKGSGHLGSLSWNPVHDITDALDGAFYKAFKFVVPSNKRYLLGIDISGSMDSNMLGSGKHPSPVSAREAAAAMAMVTYMSEPSCVAVGFTSNGGWGRGHYGLTDIAMSRRERLDVLVNRMQKMPMGATDASLPIQKAIDEKLHIDTFAVYTDNETWSGLTHVSEKLEHYRQQSGINAKLVAVGMTANEYSVVDPKDPRQMNVVGFDSSAPAVISDFAKGN